MPRAPISVCLIVRDEADNLARCLDSVRNVCEEIIVVDTGSQDGSPRLAAELGARVFSFSWVDDFSAARNYAAQQASQPFILRFDADERLDRDSLPALVAYCEREPAFAGRALRKNIGGENSSESITCLYPNTRDYQYERRIHEQLRYRGQAPLTVATDLVIHHYGYSPDVMRERRKAERNLSLLEQELAESPNDPYVHFQLGQTQFVQQQYLSAADHFARARRLLGDCGSSEAAYLSLLFSQQAYAYVYLQDLQRAVATIRDGLSSFPDYTDLWFVYGVALMRLGGPQLIGEMVAAFERCLVLGEPDPARYTSVHGVGSYRAQHNLGAFREALGDIPAALGYYQQAAASAFEPSIKRLAALEAHRN